jgi:methylglutaconyl-CoA hydratase
MTQKSFIYELDSRGVAQITLNRPEVHNAFNDEMISLLCNKLDEIADDESIRLLVLTGNGKSFCAGADLNWMKGMKDYSEQENIDDSEKLADLFSKLNNLEVPVIGKINGAALGGGCGLIAVCDFVIATSEAKFGFTEVRLGLIPAVISPFVISKIGESNARAFFLSGQRFDSIVAERIGLIHLISKDLDEDCQKINLEFLKAGPKAAKAAKKLINNVLKTSDKNIQRSLTTKAISKIRVSDEGQEGMNALLEKRKVTWQR